MLSTAKESPVLQRAGYTENDFESTGNKVPTMEGGTLYRLTFELVLTSLFHAEWTFAKQAWQRKKGYRGPDLQNATILPGFKEKVYA